MIHSVLIANRGEIAVRIVRACHELGLRAIAVYSEADRAAPHVLAADEAYCIGPAPSSQSYLNVERLLEVARRSGADAIHPGYGFLAERAHFARAVEDAGLAFVGPRAGTIAAMGDKTEARRRMSAAGVPVVPGILEPLPDVAEAARAARDVGYPVMLKAAAGGGGKGMRIVAAEDELPGAFEAAQREALGAFGDGSLYLEKFLAAPRHIEIQILGDRYGKVIHLGERECSIQRRHQKLVEEAPSPAVTPEMRNAMGQAAVRAAQAVDYVGAGTVEFLVHGDGFYFLEMNTRIQVEHPVTEMVTGVDLVAWQLRIAGGEPLGLEQRDVRWSGHAIECRITSEDPFNAFLPSTGRVEVLEVPSGPGVRWDGGIAVGFEIGLHYDPLLGKLVAHGQDRAAAIRRMARALDELTIVGLATSVPFHRRVMNEPDFRGGALSVRYLEDHPELLDGELGDDEAWAVALAAALLEENHRARHATPRLRERDGRRLSPWRTTVWPWRRA